MSAGRRAPRFVVVGGGISGLVAAYQLRLESPEASIEVLEDSDRVGGKLDTADFPSGPMELGAEAFIGRRPEAAELVDELGLTDRLQHPGGAGSAILTGGRLVPMPRGTLMGLPSDAGALAGVLDEEDVRRAALEETVALDWTPGADAPLGALVAERFGPAVVTRLVDPMLGGVYASPSRGLGLREVVPGLAAALDEGAPSLTVAVRGLLSRPRGGPVFATFDGGYRVLVDALVRASGATVRTGTACRGLRVTPGGRVEVTDSRGAREADGVVLAVPVSDAVPLLGGSAPSAAEALATLRTASSGLVAFEIGRDAPLPELSGVLVAGDEPVPFKAMTFSSRKWPHLDTRPGHLVRVSFGRLGADEVLDCDDAELTALAEEGVTGLLGERPEILHSRVRRWPDGLVEIGPGHRDLVAEVRVRLAAASPALELVGAATEGVGVPACIGSARAAARRLAAVTAGPDVAGSRV